MNRFKRAKFAVVPALLVCLASQVALATAVERDAFAPYDHVVDLPRAGSASLSTARIPARVRSASTARNLILFLPVRRDWTGFTGGSIILPDQDRLRTFPVALRNRYGRSPPSPLFF